MTDAQPWNKWITLLELGELYRENIRRFGGSFSLPKPGCVEACLGNAYSALSYIEPIENERPVIFAVYVLFYLIRSHCYVDGNKRIGWIAAMYILYKEKLTVRAGQDEFHDFCLAIASGETRSADDALLWLKPRVEALPD